MSQKTYGIDFGTSTIKVYKKGEGIILLEKNVVATIDSGKKAVAIGEKAYEMFEKVPPSIHVSFPLNHGVIADMQDMVALWNFMMPNLGGHRKLKGGEFYIAVPADITEVEKQAYSRILAEGEYKPKRIFLIDKPVADAYGLGIDVEKTSGVLIVNIGADTTELSVISLGGIVVTKLLPYGGNWFDNQIMNYVRKEYNFVIGRRTAEIAKKSLVSAEQSDVKVKVTGRDIVKGLPGVIELSSQEIYPIVKDIFGVISSSVRSMLERTPPEISREITHDGLYLTGASSWITGLDKLIASETNIKTNTTKDAQKTVAKGLGYLAEHPKLAAAYVSHLK